MKPWLEDTSWFERYAQRSVALKSVAHNQVGRMADRRDAIAAAFTKVYNAVAVDIDGTLTEPGVSCIDVFIARQIGWLLYRRIPVILITGRGRTTGRVAATELRAKSGLSDGYFRNLQCVTHNGVYLLETPHGTPADLLGDEQQLIAVDEHRLPSLAANVERVVREALPQLSGTPVTVSTEPGSVRVICGRNEDASYLEQALCPLILEWHESSVSIFLTRGTYSQFTCLDLTGTNKKLALDHVATRLEIEPDQILRVGDQGQEGGNDFDLLDSPSGFSVNGISTRVDVCHPVLDEALQMQVTGPKGMLRLLDLVMISSLKRG